MVQFLPHLFALHPECSLMRVTIFLLLSVLGLAVPCLDIPNWVDVFGWDCEAYESFSIPVNGVCFDPDANDEGVDANEACCFCGGLLCCCSLDGTCSMLCQPEVACFLVGVGRVHFLFAYPPPPLSKLRPLAPLAPYS